MGGEQSKPKPKVDDFAADLVEQAMAGYLMPVIGRDDETSRVIKTLCRKNKNNPVLIGDPGVGKTAIVEGLAQRIVAGEVPDVLKGCKIKSLNMGQLVAGTKYRGMFEERMEAIIKEAKDSGGKVILFIDEMHLLLGAGGASGAPMDAANLLKPELARGEIKVIGATTIMEYRKHVEKDAALERRFQKLNVKEPSVPDTINILRGLKERYEKYHKLDISDKAIVAAAKLSARYIQGRFLPDKAIDLIDEACSNVKFMQESKNEEMEILEQRKLRLEVEARALAKEKDKQSKQDLEKVEKELAEVYMRYKPLEEHFKQVKERQKTLEQLTQRREQLVQSYKAAKKAGNPADMYALAYGELHSITADIEDLKAQGTEKSMGQSVSEDEVAGVISRWTGIPVTRLNEDEAGKLLNLEKELHTRLIGQNEAVRHVANAVMKARSGFAQTERPSSFMFLGPTGCGKTELAKALAEQMFGDEKYMVRIDMGEYPDKSSLSRLFGPPPGFAGHDDGGQLTEAVRQQPYSVVLFDEAEKADSHIFNALLPLLDDGRLTDGRGVTVNFANTIVIFTSNIGARAILDNRKNMEAARKAAEEALKTAKDDSSGRPRFSPEFLNRIDAVVVFEPLQHSDIMSIATILEKNISKRLLANARCALSITDAALAHIVDIAHDEERGARPLRRWLENNVVSEINQRMLREHANTLSEDRPVINWVVDFDKEARKLEYRSVCEEGPAQPGAPPDGANTGS